jgi:tetratricopeptide (TPR) repeat protein
MRLMRTIASLCFLLLLTPSLASAEEAFYETRLASGKQAYAEKRMPDAMTDLRIAAFGFLDRPPLLSETLVWLTLAESTAGRQDMVRWALTRFLEVETKFHPYKQLALDAASRVQFEKILVKTLSPDAIASVPTLSQLIAPAASRAKPLESAPNRPAPAQTIVPPQAPPSVPLVAAPKGGTAVAEAPVVPAAPPAKSTGSPGKPATPAADARSAETVEKAKDLLEQNKNDDALRILKELVARSPSRTARKYLLHAATRTHNWQTAAVQVPLLEPFNAGEEVTMFYAAVALYQTGKLADARPLLERSLPGINPSPYVDSYKQKIFGH